MCVGCGHGRVLDGGRPDCPTCGETVWEPALWRPFSRTGGYGSVLPSRLLAAGRGGRRLETVAADGAIGDRRCPCGQVYRFDASAAHPRFWPQNGVKSFAKEPVSSCVVCGRALALDWTPVAA